LTRVLLHLCAKPTPFRFIDTHAGDGLYSLGSDAATRTSEWRGGVGRLRDADLPSAAAGLLQPYLEILERVGAESYPGSPRVAVEMLRPGDRMICCDLMPSAIERLRDVLPKRAKIIALDGMVALNAFVPPVERRGLVFIDPPFEDPDEFSHLCDALVGAYRKWATGIFMVWYPLKTLDAGRSFAAALAEAGIARTLRLDLWIDQPAPDARLVGTGLVVVNPPYPLAAEAEVILPALAAVLGRTPAAGWSMERLGPT
jgi:23S rRNA (adenine2030-N6)-methyltransferase